MIKSRTAALLIAITFAWWLLIFFDQLNTELSCTSTDAFCNSGNTIWGDFTWSFFLWALSLSLITPVITLVALIKIRKTKSKISK